MLKKLFKYDMIALSRLLGLFSVLALLSAGIGIGAIRLLALTGSPDLDNPVLSAVFGLIGGLLIFLCVLSLIAYFIVSLFMIARRFYTHFFTDEGYLTFTLPVTPTQLLLSKYLSSVIWALITFVTTVCSVLLIYLFGPPTMPDLGGLAAQLDLLGVSSGSIVSFTAMIALDLIADLFCIFLAISLGCMIAKKHKILASIGLYYVVQTVVAMLGVPFSVISGVMTLQGNPNAYLFTSIGGIVVEVVVAVAAFFFTRMILQKRLNLS
ncbi:MAG: hypothetical protein IKS35_07515 [Clostridia bacterium]|nr:hypothetical protein [Clostridia bacterium]